MGTQSKVVMHYHVVVKVEEDMNFSEKLPDVKEEIEDEEFTPLNTNKISYDLQPKKRLVAEKQLISNEVEERKRRKREYDKKRYHKLKANESSEQILERRKKCLELARRRRAEEKRILREYEMKCWQPAGKCHGESFSDANDISTPPVRRRKSITVERILETRRKDAEYKRKKNMEEKKILVELGLMGSPKDFSKSPEQCDSAEVKNEMSKNKYFSIPGEVCLSKRQKNTVVQILAKREKAKKRKTYQRSLKNKTKMTEEELKQRKMKKFLYNHSWYRNKRQYRDRSEEEKEKSRKWHREWTRNLTAEKRERYKESVSRAQKKWWTKMKEEKSEKWVNRQEKLKEYMRRKVAVETPDERLRRHHKYKVNAAARKLKQQLTSEQVDVEEIERKVTERKMTMWKEFDPDYDKRPPKPRGRPRKKVTLPHENKPSFETADHGSIPFVASASVEKQDVGVNDFSDTFTNYTDTYGTEAVDYIDEYESHFSLCASPLSASSPQPYLSIHSMPDDTTHSSCSTVQCLYCPSVFFGDDLLRTHVCLVHDDKCWKCPICKEVVLSPTELSQHFVSSHETVQQQSTQKQESHVNDQTKYLFVCMRCSPTDNCRLSKFKSRKELFTHVKTKHSRHYWPCKHCSLLKYSEETLKFHLKICSNLKTKMKVAVLEIQEGKKKLIKFWNRILHC